MKKNTFVEGTIIASFAIIFTKILGALYVIPFYSIIGSEGGTLYSYAYNVYNLFLNISTAGLPIAMAKIISEYNTLEKFEAKERAYKLGRNIICVLAMLSFLVLFIFSADVAHLIIGDISGGSSIQDISLVIKSVSFCLLIIPFLSVTKGYLQGHKFIAPTSTSQIIEQVVRIAVVLFGSYLAINIFNTEVSIGVAIALFGAFVGGLVAYLYLKRKIKKNKNLFNLDKVNQKDKISNKEITKKILSYALPYIIIAVALDIYSLTDLSLVIRGLSYLGYSATDAELISSIIATWGVKICMIINAIAIGLCTSLIPHIVSNFVKGEMREVNRKFNKAINIIIVICFPMCIGLSFLSTEIYTIFYGTSLYGPIVLRYLSFTMFTASLYMVISMALQGMNKYKYVYFCTLGGFLLNAILDIPLMLLFNKIGIYPYYGAITATLIGYIFSISFALIFIKKDLKFKYNNILSVIKRIILPLICMVIPIIVLKYLKVFNTTSRIILVLIVIGYVIVCASIYFILTYKNKVLTDVFGEEYINKIVNKIKNIFKKKNKVNNTQH